MNNEQEKLLNSKLPVPIIRISIPINVKENYQKKWQER
jgi:hypothetical protein